VRDTSLNKFNLLVSCPRDRERAAQSEIRFFIGDLLVDSSLVVSITDISGLLTCWTSLSPFEVIHRLRVFAIENPYQFRFAIRFTPLDYCVDANLDTISKTAQILLERIEENETFRVTVRRRHTDLENMEIIKTVAEQIPRPVNLGNPDKTIWVEIVGDKAGLSVLNEKEDILSIKALTEERDRQITSC
jgi:tRNA acetyltransferase TAN1